MSELISVIVPVYKVEAYLDACVESIVNQTYKDLEIILVDDGSPDNCPAMCDEWAKKDSRIKVIHKTNGGLSDARNVGMEIATGAYIGFVDSDDIISPDMYSVLYNHLTLYSADIVQCQMLKFENLPFEYKKLPSTKERTTSYSAEEAVRDLLDEKNVRCTCPNMLLKASIARSVLFDIGRINEDVLWTYRVIAKAKKIIVTDAQLYFYYQRPGSIMNSSYSVKRFDALYALEQRAEEIKNDFPVLYPTALCHYVGGCFYHYQRLCRLPSCKEYSAFKKQIHKRFLDSDIKTVMSATSSKYKIWYFLFRLFPNFTCKIRNLLKIGL